MIVYKLTDQDMRTHGGFKWKLNKTVTVSGGEPNQCGKGWLHAYSDPLLAPLLNPIHADLQAPRLFRAKTTKIGWDDHGLKLMLRDMTLIEEVPIPVFSTKQRIAFGIFCAQASNPPDPWQIWSVRWLDGDDRSASASASARAASARAASASASASAAAASASASAASAASASASAWSAAWSAAWVSEVDLPAIALRAHQWIDPITGDWSGLAKE